MNKMSNKLSQNQTPNPVREIDPPAYLGPGRWWFFEDFDTQVKAMQFQAEIAYISLLGLGRIVAYGSNPYLHNGKWRVRFAIKLTRLELEFYTKERRDA